MCQHLLVYLLFVVSFDPPTRRHHIHRTLHGESIKRESCGGVAVTDFVTAVAGRCCWRWVAVRSGWGPPYLYLLLAAHAAAAGRPRGARSDTLTIVSSLTPPTARAPAAPAHLWSHSLAVVVAVAATAASARALLAATAAATARAVRGWTGRSRPHTFCLGRRAPPMVLAEGCHGKW